MIIKAIFSLNFCVSSFKFAAFDIFIQFQYSNLGEYFQPLTRSSLYFKDLFINLRTATIKDISQFLFKFLNSFANNIYESTFIIPTKDKSIFIICPIVFCLKTRSIWISN